MGTKLRNIGMCSFFGIVIIVALGMTFTTHTFEQQLLTLAGLGLFIVFGLCAIRLLVPATKKSESG